MLNVFNISIAMSIETQVIFLV